MDLNRSDSVGGAPLLPNNSGGDVLGVNDLGSPLNNNENDQLHHVFRPHYGIFGTNIEDRMESHKDQILTALKDERPVVVQLLQTATSKSGVSVWFTANANSQLNGLIKLIEFVKAHNDSQPENENKIDLGMVLTKADDDGNTPISLIMDRVKEGTLTESDVKLAGLLFDHGVDPNMLDRAERKGETPITLVLQQDGNEPANQQLLELLLSNGVDPNQAFNTRGLPLLHYAVKHNKPKVVRLLLRYGANLNQYYKGDLMTKRGIALNSARTEEVKNALVEAHADFSKRYFPAFTDVSESVGRGIVAHLLNLKNTVKIEGEEVVIEGNQINTASKCLVNAFKNQLDEPLKEAMDASIAFQESYEYFCHDRPELYHCLQEHFNEYKFLSLNGLGWKRHNVAINIYKEVDDKYRCVLCNRGGRPDEGNFSSQLTEFMVSQDQLLSLAEILLINGSLKRESMESVVSKLSNVAVEDSIRSLDNLSQDQIAGNCVVANHELALKQLLCELDKDNGLQKYKEFKRDLTTQMGHYLHSLPDSKVNQALKIEHQNWQQRKKLTESLKQTMAFLLGDGEGNPYALSRQDLTSKLSELEAKSTKPPIEKGDFDLMMMIFREYVSAIGRHASTDYYERLEQYITRFERDFTLTKPQSYKIYQFKCELSLTRSIQNNQLAHSASEISENNEDLDEIFDFLLDVEELYDEIVSDDDTTVKRREKSEIKKDYQDWLEAFSKKFYDNVKEIPADYKHKKDLAGILNGVIDYEDD
ncbi:MAG: ankyrin repeat domain-containing protein [Candidatus Marinamargulisbacteria bacterium]